MSRPFAVVAAALGAAATLVTTAVAARTASVPELYRRSYAAEAKGDLSDALAAMDEMGSGHDDYVASLRRGWLLHLAGRDAEAVGPYERAVALEPKALEPRLGLMLPLLALRRWVDAERVGREALAIAPGDFTTISRLAWIDYVQGRFGRAEEGYRRALGLFPSSVEMRAGLGWSLLRQGRNKEARAELERVLVVAPDQASAREGLSRIP